MGLHTRCGSVALFLIAIFISGTFASHCVDAAPLFDAQARATGLSSNSSTNVAVAAEATRGESGSEFTTNSFARAGAGFVKASSSGNIVRPMASGGPVFATAGTSGTVSTGWGGQATSVANDVHITSLSPNPTISTMMNLDLGGTLSGTKSGTFTMQTFNYALSRGDASVFFQVTITDTTNSSQVAQFVGQADYELKPGGETLQTSGLLQGYTGGPMTITTPAFDAPLNRDFTVELLLRTRAEAFMYTGETQPVSISGTADYSHTFSYATDGPVLEFTGGTGVVTSTDGFILNNTFANPEVVPEPSGLLLAAGCVAGTILSRRRR